MKKLFSFGKFILFILVLFACGNVKTQTESLSEYFLIETIPMSFRKQKHLDIYVKASNGRPEYLASVRDPEWPTNFPFGYSGLQSKQFAVSEDGRSLIYFHNEFLAGKRSKKEGGLYCYEFGKGERLLMKTSGVAAISYPKPLPEDVLVVADQAVKADGEITPILLLEGNEYHEMAYWGNIVKLDSLIEKSTPGVEENNYWEMTPLEVAIVRKNESTALRLLDYWSPAEETMKRILHLSATFLCKDVVEELLKRKTPYDFYNEAGMSPLHASLANTFPSVLYVDAKTSPAAMTDVIKTFLQYGADINFRDENGKTLLFYSQDPEIIRFLIQSGIDVNITDNNENSALIRLTEHPYDERHIEIWNTEILPSLEPIVQKTENIDCPNVDGINALHRAVQLNHIRTAEYLIANGADPDIPFIKKGLGPDIPGQTVRERIEYIKSGQWWKEVDHSKQ